MAIFSSAPYGQVGLHLMRKRADFLSDDIRGSLHTSTYVVNKDTHAFVSDLTGELATGGGYTIGGVALANKTVTYDSATDTTIFDADDISLTASTLTWRVIVFSDRTPATAATQPLIANAVGDADTISTGGTLTITMNANGIFRLST